MNLPGGEGEGLDRLAGRAAFAVRSRQYTFLDAVQAAEVRGDLAPAADAIRKTLAAEAAAAEAGLEVELAAVEAAIERFRYERNLVSAEETERWLELRGLTPDDLSDHFVRNYWPGALAAQGQEIAVDPEADLGPGWHADLFLSGAMDGLVRTFARQCALRVTAPAATDPVPDLRLARGWSESDHARWCEAWRLNDAQVAELQGGARLFDLARSTALSPALRHRLLADQGTNLLFVDLEYLAFDTLAGAREALLCLREDQLTLAQLAEQSGFMLERRSAFIRDFPEAWRMPLWCSKGGSVVGPLENGGVHHVCRIAGEREASPDDPTVAAELDRILLEQHFGRLETAEVVWLVDSGVTG